jgi:mannosyltransferase OCH1-like enzyme
MISKKIHYCRFGNNPKSDLNRKCLDSWQRVLPDYQIKQWDETNSPLDDPYSRAAYARGEWSRLSNRVRMRALYAEGGIYLDTDVEVLKNFAPLLHHKCFAGFQQAEEEVDWINSAVLGAQPGHPFLTRCVELTDKIFAETGDFPRSPLVVTRILKEMGLREYKLQEVEEVTVYPVEYFYPYPWFGKFSPDCVKENTYCIHYWEGSWLKQEHHKILSPLRTVKRMMRALNSRGRVA